MSKQYLEFGSKVKALESLGLFNFEDDNADLFDYWQFKLSPADSGFLAEIIKRKFPSFYNYRARWDLGLDEPDSIFSYGAFLDDFLVRAEKFISWRLKSQPFDSSVMAFADSLQFYGLDYEAGLYLVNLHETAADMMFDIDLLRKCYKLKLDWAFFEILQDFTASLRQKGYSFSRDAWDRLQYPLLYRDLVNYHARGLIDPYLALSVIRRESRFDPMAVSSVGAIGLMQLMPATAAQMANMDEVPLVWLFEPGYNIMLGCRYLRWLSARLAKNEVVIAAYNAGPTAAKRWQRMASDETESYIETIGYDQSRDYTRWVIGDFYWYKYFWPIEF